MASSNQNGGSGRPPPVALATGRTGVSARRGDSLDQALGNRFMSRPKVGMPLDPPAFAVLYERKGGCGGIQKLGSSRRDSGGVEESDEFRETTASPRGLRASRALAQVHRTGLAGRTLTKP